MKIKVLASPDDSRDYSGRHKAPDRYVYILVLDGKRISLKSRQNYKSEKSALQAGERVLKYFK